MHGRPFRKMTTGETGMVREMEYKCIAGEPAHFNHILINHP